MSRSAFDSKSDQIAANNAGPDPKLMCAAKGCPNLWSTDQGHLCRWHADAPPHRWPEVTRDMHNAITDRALQNGRDKPQPRALSMQEKTEILRKAQAVFTQPKPNPRAWIDALRAKQRAGIPLSAMQKHCLAQVRQTEEA